MGNQLKENSSGISIAHSLDKEKLVQDSLDLVNVDSPTGREGEAGELYASKLKELGMKVVLQEVEQGRYNVLATLKGEDPSGTVLMFNGHLDTSFAASEDPSILKAISPVYKFTPPWGYIKDDWLYGMGSFNMKSALAAYAAAVRTIQDKSIRLRGDIVIAGVVGEIEKTQVDQYVGAQYRGYGHGTAYLVTHGGTADVAILGEPTGLRLMCSHSGSCWFRIGLKGTLVHTGHSLAVSNVIQQMNRIITALEKWIPDYQSRYTFMGVKPTVNVGSIEGGWPWRASRTPGFCNLYLDVRFPPRYHALDIKEEVAKVLQTVKAEQGIDADLDVYVTDGWSEVSPEEYVAQSVAKSHENVFSKPVENVYFSWSSDANVLTRHGITAVNYGPSGGPGKETRGTMYIPNLVGCAKVYLLSALDLCSKTRKETGSGLKAGKQV
ncbi:MAG TPA: M20/M25/M40 family metallo-hydrolase [Nitrososphaerales archaeon]|nr:M20/M25/M40 family metallo-hydrolase [Nitrososphaerales archaeon]